MAEIKVQIKGDDSDLKAKFEDASKEAKVFKESITQSLDAIKASAQTVVGETGLGGITKLLGAAGLTGAAVEFSKRLVSGFKDAIASALDFQGQVGKIRTALGPAFAGQAESLVKWVEGVSTAFGGLEKNLPVFEQLLRGKMVPEEAKQALINIQNAAKQTGSDIEELGLSFAEMKERGIVPERFWKQFPQLAPIAQAMGAGEHPSADWMLRTFLPAIAPGGMEASGRLRAQQSIGGQFAANQEEFNKLWRELGTDLLPVVNAYLKEMKNQMPQITASFKALGEALEQNVPKVTSFVKDFFGTGQRIEHPTTAFGQGLKSVNDYLDKVQDNIWNLFFKPAQFLTEAAEEHKKAAEALSRITHPK